MWQNMPELGDPNQDKRTIFTAGTGVALKSPDIQRSVCNFGIEGDLNVNQHGTIFGGRAVRNVRRLQKSPSARCRVPTAMPLLRV
jgi:hypothetical protein